MTNTNQLVVVNTNQLVVANNRQFKRAFKSYALKANSRYHKQKSHFVTLSKRLNDQTSEYNSWQLEGAIKEFALNHPEWTKFKDLKLCNALIVSIDKILIDITMQRMLNFQHIINILSKFIESKVMAIQVYEDPEKPGYYIAWDGQHTAIALYIIITKVLGDKLADCMVPIVLYPVCKKSEIRKNFIGLNGEDKLALDLIDLYQQMIFGVRVDNSDYPDWISAELKQQYLEMYDLFATNSKFNDCEEPGALSRLEELMKYDPVVTLNFAKYFAAVRQNRAVDSKEAVMIYWYFNACYEQSISITDKYIQDFAFVIKNLFDADLSPEGPFWGKVSATYFSWHKNFYKQYEPAITPEPRPNKEISHGAVYLTAQMKKSLPHHKVPVYHGHTEFRALNKDLW